MKKLFFLIPFLLLLASCKEYGDKIIQTYTSQQCPMRPLDAATLDSAKKGYVVIDSAHAGNPSICAVLVKIVPARLQKYRLAKEHGGLALCYTLVGISIGLIVFGIFYLNGGGKAVIGIAAFILSILLLPFAGEAIDWAVMKEVEIPKATYDTLKGSPDGFKSFWDQNLTK